MRKLKAPKGCFWRDGVLWGRIQIKGRDHKWTLRTDDPKVARERYAEDRSRLIDHHHYGKTRMTFDEAFAQWASWIERQVAANTSKRYAVSIGQMESHLTGKNINEINRGLIAEIIRSRDTSNATIKRDLVALSSVMNFCVAQGWLDANPVLPQLRLIKERRDPIVLPLATDVEKVLARLPKGLRELTAAARVTGARQEELANARRSQLDLERKRLEVIGKGNKRRVIDLTPFDGWKVFTALPPSATYLFWHGPGKRYENVSSRFASIVKSLKLEHRFRFHDLRHLHAVEWLQSGRSIYDLQQRLGHSSLKTTELYLQFLTPEEKRAAQGL